MIKISFRLWHFERRATRVKGFNKSKISCLINKVMAEFKCLHNSSYLGLVYTWNFKGAIDLLFFSQRLQQS